MQLNELNNKNDKQILKKQKLDYKYKMKKILLINKIFIIENILDNNLIFCIIIIKMEIIE